MPQRADSVLPDARHEERGILRTTDRRRFDSCGTLVVEHIQT